MGNVRGVIKKYGKIYAAAVILAFACDMVGTIRINIGIGTLTLFPMVFAVILGGLLGPDLIRMFNQTECKLGGSMVLVALAPFMAKMGVSAGANLAKLVAVGPALILQEFGNLGTIFISLPVALLLGLKVHLRYTSLVPSSARYLSACWQGRLPPGMCSIPLRWVWPAGSAAAP